MDTNLLIGLVASALLVVGWISKATAMVKLSKKRNEVAVYLNNYSLFLKGLFEDHKRDSTLLNEVVKDAHYIQGLLGSFGIVSYKPPAQGYIINNHALILNSANLMASSDASTLRLFNDVLVTASNSMIQYISECDRVIKGKKTGLWNPITAFFEGVSKVLSLPLYLLTSSGLLQQRSYGSITGSRVWKLITAIIGLISFLYTVASIMLDWDAIMKLFGIIK